MLCSRGCRLASLARVIVPSLTRSLSNNRSFVCRVNREQFLRTYPTLLVRPDGSTVSIRYPMPRGIVKLPIDLENCSEEDLRRVRKVRRPVDKLDKVEEVETEFDPMQYIQQ